MDSEVGARILFYSVVGFGVGLYLFVKGFRVHREYRLLADTPEVPIRSIAMGLVEIHGKAAGETVIPSPVTNTPCYAYKVNIEKWKTDSKGRGSWHNFKTDVCGVRFYLEDASGKVLVDLANVEYDLQQNEERETGGSGSSSFTTRFSGGKKLNPSARDWPAEYELAAYVSRVAAGTASILPLTSASNDPQIASQSSGGGLVNQLVSAGGLSLGGSASGRFRLTEYCITPGQSYDLTGTCTENPDAQDEHDRNLIVKGENEPTFLISYRSEQELEGSLRSRARWCVFGGGALSLVCLVIILGKLGLF